MVSQTRRFKFKLNPKSVRKSPFRTMTRVKEAERKYKRGESIGFTATSSLKSMGRIPRSSGCYVLGEKYIQI